MLDTTTQTQEPVQTTAPAVVAPVVAPTPALDTYVSRFTPEQISSVDASSPEAVKAFVATLSVPERDRILKSGGNLSSLLGAEPQRTDPAPVVTDPAAVVAPVVEPAPAETGSTLPSGDDKPSWMLTEEQLAAATPETINLYKAHLDLLDQVEATKPAELDPIYKDPRIEYLKGVIATGELDLPPVTINDLLEVNGGTLESLYQAVDQAHLAEDPKVWVGAVTKLVNTAVQETIARSRIAVEAHIAEARQEGAKAVEFKYGLKDFLGQVPEFKGALKPIFTENGNINPESPAVEFVKFLSNKDNAEAFGPIFHARGVQGGLQLAWTAFQSEKSGGFNQMMAGVRANGAKTVTQGARNALDKFLASRTAPSVGTVQVPSNSGNNQALYHGFDLRGIQTQEQVKQVYNALRAQGNIQGANGLAAALAGASR